MTRDEQNDLACLTFSADLVLQTFCHTAAYPKPEDVKMYAELPQYIYSRGGVAIRPGDGVLHSWLNRMAMPDSVGTGGDSHTRFPIGVYFPAGSGLCALASATGVMPLDMPESVLVRFKGEMQPRRHPSRSRQCHSVLRFPARAADGRQERQEEHLLGPHPRNRGAAEPDCRTGLRDFRRLGRAFRRSLHRAARQGTDRRVHAVERRAAQVDGRQRLSRSQRPPPPHPQDGSLAQESADPGTRRQR